jgi:hypothetical protein
MSRSAKFHLAILASLGFSTAVSGETLSELRARVSGVEVLIEGHIGTGLVMMDDEALVFRDADEIVYTVVFDAGRTARKSLEGCKFAMFGGGSPCAFAGKAEIELDGAQIRLIIFEVTAIGTPTPLN